MVEAEIGTEALEPTALEASTLAFTAALEPHDYQMTQGPGGHWLLECFETIDLTAALSAALSTPPQPGVVGELVEPARELVAALRHRIANDTASSPYSLMADAAGFLSALSSAITAANADRDRLRVELDRANELLSSDELLERAVLSAVTIDSLQADRARLARELEEAVKFVEAADRVIAKQREEVEEAREALVKAKEEFDRISCEHVTETRNVSDALERAHTFAHRGAVTITATIRARPLTPTGGGEHG